MSRRRAVGGVSATLISKDNMKDKYDKAVEYLTENPSAIRESWNDPCNNVDSGGILFMAAAPRSHHAFPTRPDGIECGCLTTIRRGTTNLPNGVVQPGDAWTDELTHRIRSDDRIPMTVDDIRVEHLPVFAEWQRRLDKELDRA